MKEILDSKSVSQIAPEVYQDAIKPAAQELSKGLVVVAKAVNLALEPVKGVVWGYDTIKNYIIETIPKKLEGLPKEQIVEPPLNVAGPLIESMKYSAYNESLREMYANLLATSMNLNETHKAHPSFVEIIKQLTSDEAKIICHISSSCTVPEIHHTVVNVGRDDFVFEELREKFYEICFEIELERKDLVPSYLDNLRRLQLIEFDQKLESEISSKPEYLNYAEYSDLSDYANYNELEFRRFEFLKVTDFGIQFMKACVST